MAGRQHPLAGGAAPPTHCKIRAGGANADFRVDAVDLPVALVMKSTPATCHFKIQAINIYDVSGGTAPVYSKNGIGATTADLPAKTDAGPPFAPGIYRVFVVPSPATGATPGNPYNGGTATTYESCGASPVLSLANVNFPMPYFTLEVV